MFNLTKRRKSFLTKLLLAILGAAYFTAFSQFNISIFLRGYTLIIPLQIFALFYVLYFHITTKESYSSTKSSN